MDKEKLIEFAGEQCKIFPENSEMGKYLRETLKILQESPCEDVPDTNVGNKMQKEPCGDAVSRKDLERLKRWRLPYDTKTTIPKSDLFVKLTDIRALPSVKSTQGWVPVSERLPEENGFYLATCDGEICGENEPFTGLAEYENGKWVDDEEDYQCVLAWMPLPKPYKADADPVEEMEKHTDRQIYDGCIHLMQKMVDYFQEYTEYLGYDLDKLDEDERFAAGISNMEIVRQLFLQHTRNSGGCSTRDFCEKLDVDPYKSVKFEFDRGDDV